MIFIFIFTIVKMVMFTESGLRNHNPYSLPVLWINSQLDNDTFQMDGSSIPPQIDTKKIDKQKFSLTSSEKLVTI